MEKKRKDTKQNKQLAACCENDFVANGSFADRSENFREINGVVFASRQQSGASVCCCCVYVVLLLTAVLPAVQ